MQRLWGPRDVRIQGRQLAGQGIDQAPKQLQHQQGKLPELNGVITDIPGLLQADGFEALLISLAHGLRASGYSLPHRDPFDRMLAAQAELDRLVLLSSDPQLSTFSRQTLW